MINTLLANPVAFKIGSLEVYWYGIIITAAILIATIFCMFECKRHKGSTDYILTLFLWVVPIAIVFARLAYVVFHPKDFFPVESWADFKHIWDIREGGISILGAIPGGILGAFINYIITKKSKNATNKMDFRELLDILAPSMILGQALGRWGNFVNQELYGAEITNPKFQCFPFAVQIDVHPVYENGVFVTNLYDHWFQATFFYEMVLNLIGFAIIVIIGRKCKKNLAPLTFYLTWYLAVRSVMESLRTDAVVSNGIHVGVVGCAIGAAISFIVFVLILTNVIHTGVPKYIVDSTPIEPDEE